MADPRIPGLPRSMVRKPASPTSKLIFREAPRYAPREFDAGVESMLEEQHDERDAPLKLALLGAIRNRYGKFCDCETLTARIRVSDMRLEIVGMERDLGEQKPVDERRLMWLRQQVSVGCPHNLERKMARHEGVWWPELDALTAAERTALLDQLAKMWGIEREWNGGVKRAM